MSSSYRLRNPLFRELRYRMPHASANPFADRCACRHVCDACERFRNAADTVKGNGVFQQAGRLDMRMRVDQAGDDGLASGIKDLGCRACKTADIGLIADADDFRILDGHAASDRKSRIDRDDLGVDDDHVRVEVGAVCFKRHACSLFRCGNMNAMFASEIYEIKKLYEMDREKSSSFRRISSE